MELKRCVRCRIGQELIEFYRDNRKPGGRRAYCRTCSLKAYQLWRSRPGKMEICLRASKKYRDKHPEVVKEIDRNHSVVRTAMRSGKLCRPSVCSKCGKKGKIEAAHNNYAKALDLRWLCISCHRRWDRSIPKLVGVA